MTLEIGQRLGNRYKVVGCLGTGAYGPVFLARDQVRNDDLVALKVFHEGVLGSKKVRSRLLESLEIIRDSGSDELVRPLEYIDSDGFQAVAMEYVQGRDLGALLETRSLSEKEVQSLLYTLLREVSRLHGRGVVHNDICPAHIFFSSAGETKLAGFPQKMGAQTGTALPMSLRIGTAHFKAPEFLQTGYADARSDIYSLGMLGLELLGENSAQIKGRSLSEYEDLRRELVSICRCACSRDPEQRFQTADEMLTALKDGYSSRDWYELSGYSLLGCIALYIGFMLAILYFISSQVLAS